MENNEKKISKNNNKPDMTSDGVALWFGKTKEGKRMDSIKVKGLNEYLYVFDNEKKEVKNENI